MNIHWIFKLIFKCFNLCFLIEEIFFLETYFSSEFINTSDLLLYTHEFISFICQIWSESVKLFLFVFVINFTLCKIGVWEFNLFIKHSQLLISLYKLCAKNVSFIANHIVIFLLFGLLLFSLLDNFFQMTNVILLVLDDLFSGLDLSLCSVLVSFYLHIFSLHFFVLFIQLN